MTTPPPAAPTPPPTFQPPVFARLERPAEPFADEPPELDWLADALAGRPRAVWWQAAPGLVAPTSYRRHAALAEASAAMAVRGWPVRLRRSGGGVVPQGPGIVNLSLAYSLADGPGRHADAVYGHLCGGLAGALAGLGIDAHPAEVQGSFCDGRFNLAVNVDGRARKIAGTAQYWRRAGERHAVLAHALLLVDADLYTMTGRANDFEERLDSGRCYRADALVSVRQAASPSGVGPVDGSLGERLGDLLAERLVGP